MKQNRQACKRPGLLRALATLGGTLALVLAAHWATAQDKPGRVVLVVIDGLHVEAPDRLGLQNFAALSRQGTSIGKVTGIMPYHPAHGEYASVHTCSFPNPMMMAGTIFLSAGQDMLQHSFGRSAFVANSRSYQSITEGYEVVIQEVVPDDVATDHAIDILEGGDVDFLRIHLQDTGNGGSETLEADENAPYRHNIWHDESPYVANAIEADRQVGRLIDALRRLGQWDDTLFVVTSDHGQTKSGWHPVLAEESWSFPAVIHGPGVRKNHRIESADQIDIVPTIAHLMQARLPNADGGTGRVLTGVLEAGRDAGDSASRILELNRIFARYIVADAGMILASGESPFLNSQAMSFANRFYGLDRVMHWSELGSLEALAAHNLAVVRAMEQALADQAPAASLHSKPND